MSHISQFSRESYGRTQSERLIDRIFLKGEKELQKNKPKIIKQQVINDKQKKENSQQKSSENQEGPKEKKPHEALNILMKNLKTVKDFQKAEKILSMIQALFTCRLSIKQLKKIHILDCLFQLILNSEKFNKNTTTRKLIKNIFELIEHRVEKYSKIAENEDELFFNRKELTIFKILRIDGLFHSLLYTDDNHQFSKYMSIIQQYITEEYNKIQEYNIKKIQYQLTDNDIQKQEEDKIQAEMEAQQIKNKYEKVNKIKKLFNKKDREIEKQRSLEKAVQKNSKELTMLKNSDKQKIVTFAETQKNEQQNEENINNENNNEKINYEKVEQTNQPINSDEDEKKNQNELQPEQQQQQLDDNYEYTVSEKLQSYINDQSLEKLKQLKFEIFVSIIVDVFNFYATPWAKPSINILFNDLLNKQHIFTEEQINKINDCRAQLNSFKNQDQVQKLQKDTLDNLIMKNPLQSKNEVQDGRTLTFTVEDNSGAWASKQLGF